MTRSRRLSPNGSRSPGSRTPSASAPGSTAAPSPVFVHCHHGQHRGPAAAAVCEIAADGWNAPRARAWMTLAGTDAAYSGLFRDVDLFQPPTAGELDQLTPEDLPERAAVPAL